jgi:hypothetical protein
MDGGIERVDETSVQAQLRAQARKVYLQSIGLAALLTVLVEVLP